MKEIIINEETIAAYKEIICNPRNYGFAFDSIKDFFIKSETVTAKHILANEYLNHMNLPLPKVILYIVMNELFGECNGKDEKWNLGYYLKSKTHEINSSPTNDEI